MLEGVLLSTLVGALVPVFSDTVGAIVAKFTGGSGALPKNIDDVIRLQTAELARLNALATMDTPAGNVSPWVADLRASFRPIIACVMLTAAFTFPFILDIPEDTSNNVFMLAGAACVYIFGERTMLKRRGVA